MGKYFLLIVLSIAISSCNLPFSSTAEPTVDLIGTQVAVSLSQQPTITKTAPGTVSPSKPATTQVTTVPSRTFTPQPTITSSITSSPTISLSTATPTTAKSPTQSSSDPRANLGKPTWQDTFANGKGWGLEDNPYDDGNTRVEIKNNAFVLTSFAAKGWWGWRVSYPKVKDFYLEATFQVETCALNDQYGLVFRSPDQSSGYWFGITCDGRYFLREGDVNSFTEVVKFAPGAAIKPGSNQVNRLGVWIKGNKLSLYANGKSLVEIADSSFPDEGTFGYFISGIKTLNFTVKSTEIAYWNLP